MANFLIQISMELLFVTVQLLSLHLKKYYIFLMKYVILLRDNYYVTYATDGSISGRLVNYRSTEQIS